NQLLRWILEFDDRERSSLWIVQDRKASDARNVFGRLHDTTTEISDLLHFRIAIVDRKVNQPVWRHWSHFRSYFVHATITAISVFEDRVLDWALGKWFGGPTKHVSIKLSCLRSIASAKFVPGK